MVAGIRSIAFRGVGSFPPALRFGNWLLTTVLALLCLAISAQASPIEITDVMGRKVTLEAPARRIVMGAGRQLPVLGLLYPNPASLLVAWRGDFKLDPAQYGDWAKAFPEIDALPVIGGNAADGLPVETIATLKPDLVVLSLYDAEATPTRRSMDLLEELHIPVIVVDFFSHPLENSLPSLKILGRAIGAEDRAKAFATFYQNHLDLVRDRLAKANPKPPRVFMHVHAGGMPCCPTPGHGVFNDMIALAGGTNVALDHVPGLYGDVSLEQLITDDPDVYVATGGAHLAARGGLVLGPDITRADATASFDKLLANPGLSHLTAVRQGRAFALWHMFNDTPAHIAMIEFLAKAFHPDLFADLDPQATIDAINRDLLPVPMNGTYWLDR